MLEVQVLGPLRVVRDDVELPVAGMRQRALLARLALAGGRVGVDALIRDLWGEEPARSAPNSLQVAVSGLRKTLGGGAIRTLGGGYLLDGAVEVDRDRFTAEVPRGLASARDGDDVGAVAWFALALGRWRGEPLADLAAPFVPLARDALTEQRLEALEALAASRARLGHASAIVVELTPVAAAHPLRESLVAHLALALAATGRRVEALDLLTATRRRLADEFGIAPGAELQRAQVAVLRNETTVADAPRIQPLRTGLPHLPPPMLGRDVELARALTLVRDPSVRLVTITGPAGVGKSRLAEAIVEAAPESTAHVSLLTAEEADDVPAVIAQELGIPVGGREPAAAVVDAFRRLPGASVLVLDELEHLLGAGAVVDRLLADVPALTVVAAGRFPLFTAAEHRLLVEPLATVPVKGRMSPAAELFVGAAHRLDPTLTLTPADRDTAIRIGAACDGLPLALELAAGWAGTFPLRVIEQRLEDRLTFLVDPRRPAGRSSSMAASVRWSLDALAPDVIRTLEAASVFAGRFDSQAVGAVAGIPESEAAAHLLHLVDRCLVARSRPPGRFELLQIVRETVRERLSPEQVWRLRTAHTRYFRRRLGTPPPTRNYPVTREEFDEIAAERGNLRTAARFAQRIDLGLFVDLMSSLATAWTLFGYGQELTAGLQIALARPELTAEQRFDCLLALHRAEALSGDDATADALLLDAAELGVEDEPSPRMLEVRLRQAESAQRGGRSCEGRRLLPLLRHSDEPVFRLRVELLTARLTADSGDIDGAVSALRRLLVRAQALGLDLPAQAVRGALAELLLEQGACEEAEALALETIGTAPAEDVLGRAEAMVLVGTARLLRHDFPRAAPPLLTALDSLADGPFHRSRLAAALALASVPLVPLTPDQRYLVFGVWDAVSARSNPVWTRTEQRLQRFQSSEPPLEEARRAGAELVDSVGIDRALAVVVEVLTEERVHEHGHR